MADFLRIVLPPIDPNLTEIKPLPNSIVIIQHLTFTIRIIVSENSGVVEAIIKIPPDAHMLTNATTEVLILLFLIILKRRNESALLFVREKRYLDGKGKKAHTHL